MRLAIMHQTGLMHERRFSELTTDMLDMRSSDNLSYFTRLRHDGYSFACLACRKDDWTQTANAVACASAEETRRDDDQRNNYIFRCSVCLHCFHPQCCDYLTVKAGTDELFTMDPDLKELWKDADASTLPDHFFLLNDSASAELIVRTDPADKDAMETLGFHFGVCCWTVYFLVHHRNTRYNNNNHNAKTKTLHVRHVT